MPASGGWPDGVIAASDYAVMAADIAVSRDSGAPFDLVLIGDAAGTVPDLDEYGAAGVTWVLLQALTLDDTRRLIAGGPPGRKVM